jgi:ElaB/YqjD/DUF883 family membrane-anchored ribosome-binding protein
MDATLDINQALDILNKEAKGKRDEINRLISEKYSNLKDMIEETKRGVKESVVHGEEKAKELATGIDRTVHSNPWLAVGVAMASGLILGYLVETLKEPKMGLKRGL